MVGTRSVILLLGSETWIFIGDLWFLAIIDGFRFAPEISYLGYCRSYEEDWDAWGMEAPFLGYDLETLSVEVVVVAVLQGQ